MTKQTCWHWPDHIIRKRESRRLRNEHNALANSYADLLQALQQIGSLPELKNAAMGTDAYHAWLIANQAVANAKSDTK